MTRYFKLLMLGCSMVLLFLVAGCATENPLTITHFKYIPKYPLNPKPKRILLLNTCNIDSNKYRKNKEELFKKFIDSVLLICKTEINKRESIDAEMIPGLTNISGLPEDTMHVLMERHQTTHAIIITEFDVNFTQTNVKVEKNSNGSKSREAFYDINSSIRFLFYSGDSLLQDLQMTKSAYHGSKNVISGLLAAGPNVVVQKKDAWRITRSNLDDYLNVFFRN